ncbi:MAG TPA: peptide chain release factor N(5)-glutamine methyltransferase [Chloroflexi bacterium]|nr:peptide chain release factor N(5)-glutamine methyltransferase [Chloroflexota bacterium]
MTVGSILNEGSALLHPITDAPRLEAEVLLSHVTGLPRATLLAHPERPLPPAQRRRYRALLQRRAAGYPLPYLTGRVEFYGLEFAVTPDVLIPRPETERLVELALARRPRTAVDVGTGSGCVAVTLAVHLPDVRVYATDLSGPALRVAAANARRHSVAGRVRLIQCDLFGPLAGPVDLVVANPPYVAAAEWASLPTSVRRYEPRLALDGGADGLAVIRRLLGEAPRLLGPGGTLLVEIGAEQGKDAAALARALYPGARVAVHPDLAGRDRVLEVSWPLQPHLGS